MPTHPFQPFAGRLETVTIDSTALRRNLLGDPHVRTVAVYLPPEYDRSEADYPVLVDLAGFTGSGLKHLAWRAFDESVPQRIDRLVSTGKMGPIVAVFPDAFTSLGGNQYVNSQAMGRWEDYLLEEMLPRIEAEFRVRRGPNHRAVFGKSSGGYGAIVQALRHGAQWAAAACHSGDMGFDILYRRDLPLTLDVLARHGGDAERFVDHLRSAKKIRGSEMHALMILAMAATYDPDPTAALGIRLPVDPHTAELDPERWERWLAHDPLVMVERADAQANLRRLRTLYIDCGSKDQYFIHYGSRNFVRSLGRLGIDHRYEEFDDDHSGVDYRMDVSLPVLFEAVSGS